MRLIGLTGGIASGKSTVRELLEARGAAVLDADAVYHQLIAPAGGSSSELAQAVGARFPGVLRDDGSLDRQALGKRVFADAQARQALAAITHPAVAREVGRRAAELREAGCELLVYDVPLLYENGLEGGMAGVIVVWVTEPTQVRRLAEREGISGAEARQRIASQMPLDEKRRQATWVIDNSGDLEATHEQVARLWAELTAD